MAQTRRYAANVEARSRVLQHSLVSRIRTISRKCCDGTCLTNGLDMSGFHRSGHGIDPFARQAVFLVAARVAGLVSTGRVRGFRALVSARPHGAGEAFAGKPQATSKETKPVRHMQTHEGGW